MSVSTVTHLNFAGDARQALEFYRSVFGGELTLVTYGDYGAPKDSPDADRVIFGRLAAADGFRLAGYDVIGRDGGGIAGTSAASVRRADSVTHTESCYLLLNGQTVEEITALWAQLADGADVIEPLGPARWAAAYGMLTDRFGVTWVFGIDAA